MSAVIVPYVPPGYDDGRPRLMVECLECGIEWGWTLESSEYAKYLPSMAVEHNARYHAREANVTKTMAEVLVTHQRMNSLNCLCGWAELGKSHPEHQARELEAAGYGMVADAKREALTEAADDVDLPGSSASGYYASEQDSGYREAERHVEAWLRNRAYAEMRQG